MMIVQSVQCHVGADCTGRMDIQLTWQAQLVLMWQLLEVTCGRMTGHTDVDVDEQVDQFESDTCHHYKGDTWHIHTTYVARPYGDTWHMVTRQVCWQGRQVADIWTDEHLTCGRFFG
jgi:hypothetical protein